MIGFFFLFYFLCLGNFYVYRNVNALRWKLKFEVKLYCLIVSDSNSKRPPKKRSPTPTPLPPPQPERRLQNDVSREPLVVLKSLALFTLLSNRQQISSTVGTVFIAKGRRACFVYM